MTAGTEPIVLEEINRDMTRAAIMEILKGKYGDHLTRTAPEFLTSVTIEHCLGYVEEALFRLVEDKETMLDYVLPCLIFWPVIDLHRRIADEDRKTQISIWMTGKVTETIFMETTENLNPTSADQPA